MSCGAVHSQARELVAQGYAATLVAATLLISRSSLYYRGKPRGGRADRRYDEQIVLACGEKVAYGYRRIAWWLLYSAIQRAMESRASSKLRYSAAHTSSSFTELIVHAGDVGGPGILSALRELAPVIAVRGNVDRDDWAKSLPESAVARAGDVLLYVLHDVNALDLDPAAAGFHVVVSGHSHQPGKFERNGVLYINPGSAGPRRFQLPVCVARFNLACTPFEVEFVELGV